MVIRRGAGEPAPPRRFECVVLDWIGAQRRNDDLAELRGLVEALCDGGMHVVLLASGSVEDLDAEVRARPRGPGRLLLCASGSVCQVEAGGFRLLHRHETGAGDDERGEAVRWLIADLWARGIEPDAVLAMQGYGPGVGGSVRDILTDQLRLRTDTPIVSPQPEWSVVVDRSERRLSRVHESLLTLADGRLGTRGTPVVADETTTPAVFMAGVYDGTGSASHLAELPLWSVLGQHEQSKPVRQTLDLRTGVLFDDGPVRSLRFSSLARPGTVVMRASAPPELLPGADRRTSMGGTVAAAFRDARNGETLDRLGAYEPDLVAAETALADAEKAGFERLLAEHRRAWVRRWRHADVVIDGDPATQQAIRFALFHLMSSVGVRGEAAVGARGLSGAAYLGHVFWDSDVFVLPFLAATHPAAARAMLEYRIRRLPAARAAAHRVGLRGARFPWESAADGVDVTPRTARLPTGEELRIRTGECEEHIVADVAWAAACYLDWTGDTAFAVGSGGALVADTARYWASRVRLDADGRAHIDGVVGPDEYHQPVDDNAFTNAMARWNLRRAAAHAAAPADEVAQWLAIADALVDGFDRGTGIYEQFAGFFELEPIVIAELSPRRPIAADLLLGVARTAGSQVIKQADVLMLHHLVPDETEPGSLPANLAYYEPRTAHGSSLSPAVHASLLARAGRADEALAWLRVAARMDLDDLSATTAGGLHLATMGGLWQALAFGFAGLRVRADRLVVQPSLPSAWRSLDVNVRFRGAPLRLHIEPDSARVDSDVMDCRQVDDHWEVVRR